jgi:hypothetical protein
VVRAEGPTAYRHDVYEPNLRDDGLANDLADVVLGDPAPKQESPGSPR